MKQHIHFSALALLSSLFIAGCGPHDAAQTAAPQRPAPSVSVVQVEAEEIVITRELPGRAAPFLIAEVRPQVDGIVEERLFAEGSLVAEGQALYQLDDARYQASYQVAKATLENAESALQLARTEAARSQKLFQSKAISAQEYDSSQAILQQAEAQAKLAAASLDSSEITLNYSRISSPISGRISKSSVTKGALVTANQPSPLATIQQLDPIYIDLTQSSSELLSFRRAIANGDLQSADLPVKLILEDGSEHPYPGKLSFSEVSVDPTTGTYTLRVETPNPEHTLLPGMYVRGIVSEGLRPEGILIPQKAVSRRFDGSTSVMVVGADNSVESRPVELGQSIGHRWIVESGLQPGDRVIVNGLQKAPAGATVQISASESSKG